MDSIHTFDIERLDKPGILMVFLVLFAASRLALGQGTPQPMQSRPGKDWQIKQATTAPANRARVHAAYPYIAWEQTAQQIYSLELYDTEQGKLRTVITGNSRLQLCGISTTHLVYQNNQGRLIAYNITNNEHVTIAENSGGVVVAEGVVAWCKGGEGSWQIWIYDLRKTDAKLITENPSPARAFNTDGSTVVWFTGQGESSSLHAMHIASGRTRKIFEGEQDRVSHPLVAGNFVIWLQNNDKALDSFLECHNLATNKTWRINTRKEYVNLPPDISNHGVTWSGGGATGLLVAEAMRAKDPHARVYYYDFSTLRKSVVSDTSFNNTNPRTENRIVGWTSHKPGASDHDVVVWDGKSRKTLVHAGVRDGVPAISGEMMVWRGRISPPRAPEMYHIFYAFK